MSRVAGEHLSRVEGSPRVTAEVGEGSLLRLVRRSPPRLGWGYRGFWEGVAEVSGKRSQGFG